MVCSFEQVRVGAERDGRVGVPELAADEDDVQTLCDQQRGETVAEGVEGALFGLFTVVVATDCKDSSVPIVYVM